MNNTLLWILSSILQRVVILHRTWCSVLTFADKLSDASQEGRCFLDWVLHSDLYFIQVHARSTFHNRMRQTVGLCAKAEHECRSPTAHYRYTRGKTCGYETRGSKFLVITGLHRSGFSLWCCEYLPQVLVRLSKVLFIYFTNFTYHYISHFNCYLPEHWVWMRKFLISDRFHEIHRSSLDTCLICIILSAFERRGH